MNDLDSFETIYTQVRQELEQILSVETRLTSPYEGWAKIKAEVDDLWQSIHTTTTNPTRHVSRFKAIRVAAAAIRFAIELK